MMQWGILVPKNVAPPAVKRDVGIWISGQQAAYAISVAKERSFTQSGRKATSTISQVGSQRSRSSASREEIGGVELFRRNSRAASMSIDPGGRTFLYESDG